MADTDRLPNFDSVSGDITPVRVLLSELKNAVSSVLQEQGHLLASQQELQVHLEAMMKELSNSKLQVSHVSRLLHDVITVLLFITCMSWLYVLLDTRLYGWLFPVRNRTVDLFSSH